ncbi:unnamed protein product [Schistosoma intercalatum]|nr:unnamed protein product [Schistosoma intercalatum]
MNYEHLVSTFKVTLAKGTNYSSGFLTFILVLTTSLALFLENPTFRINLTVHRLHSIDTWKEVIINSPK